VTKKERDSGKRGLLSLSGFPGKIPFPQTFIRKRKGGNIASTKDPISEKKEGCFASSWWPEGKKQAPGVEGRRFCGLGKEGRKRALEKAIQSCIKNLQVGEKGVHRLPWPEVWPLPFLGEGTHEKQDVKETRREFPHKKNKTRC